MSGEIGGPELMRGSKVLVILGPTAVGKTELAVKLAKKFDGELIAADSRQVYKGLDIGTGKYSPTDSFKKFAGYWLLNDVWIHGYDLGEPDQQFTAADFAQFFWKTVKKIWEKSQIPILVGGTGFYIKAALTGFGTLGISPNPKLRKSLEKLTVGELGRKLTKIAPEKAENLSSSDKLNRRRLIRAIEVAQYLKSHPNSVSMYPYINGMKMDVLKIGLHCPREILYKRIDDRVNQWFEAGFVEEVKKLIEEFSEQSPGLTSLGYRQVAGYLNNKCSLGDAIQKVKFAHHNFARRQLTWFRRELDIVWFDITVKNYYQKVEKRVKKWLNNEWNANKN